MEIIINDNMKNTGNTAVALGNFDGVHIGHQELIKTTVSKGRELELKPSVFTFIHHTSNVLKSNTKTENLMSNHDREKVLDNLGINLLYLISFNEKIRKMQPEEFIKKILVGKLNAKLIVVGFNFRFGYMAKGDTDLLIKLGNKYNYKVIVIDPILVNNEIVSTTLIKKYISQGDIKKANKLLTRPYTIEGKVISGKGLGKKLGFATANLKLNCNFKLPKFGVYRTESTVENKKFHSITSVGYNPTFDDEKINIETHIFNFNRDIYGKEIRVSFLEFIREEMKFNSKEELVEQIRQDIIKVRNVGN